MSNKGHDHKNKKKLTTKERKAVNHLKLMQGKQTPNDVTNFNQTQTQDQYKKAA